MSNSQKSNGYKEIFKKMYDTTKNKITNKNYDKNFFDEIIGYLIHLKDYSNKTNNTLFIGIFSLLIFLIILGYYIFIYNPYKILDFAQIPIIFIYLILLFYVIIYFSFMLKQTQGNTKSINTSYESNLFTMNYFKLLLVCIVCFILVLVTYTTISSILITSLNISTILYFIIIIIFVAIIIKQFNLDDIEPTGNPIFEFLKELILYIPCLLIDAIDYIKKDYKDTPNVTKILFILLLIISVIYFFTMYYTLKKNKGGIILIDSPENLNKDIVFLDNTQLKNIIIESKPFYEKEIYKIQLNRQTEIYKNTIFDVCNNMVSTPDTISRIPSYADKFSKHIYREGFTSVLSQETIPVHLTIDEYDKYILQQILWENPELSKTIKDKEEKNEDINEYIQKLIEKYKDIISFYEKTMLYLSTYFNKNFTITIIDDIKSNSYHYSMSFWIFLNPNPSKNKNNMGNKKDVIFKYGNRPSMYFMNESKEITLEYITKSENSNTPTVLYKTNNILFQRWNSIVINNNYGEIDLFINGNLMGNYKSVVNYSIDPSEILEIGSINNSDLGGITEFYYYENPLKLNQISEIYKKQKSF